MASTTVPAPELLSPGELDLAALWDTYLRDCAERRLAPQLPLGLPPAPAPTITQQQQGFLDYLRTITSEPDAIDDVAFCDNCHGPVWEDTLCSAKGDDSYRICEPCWESWADCACCENRYPPGDLRDTLDGSGVCEYCRDSYYSWCEECDGWYYEENGGHEHDHDCWCDSPQTAFTVRNDGDEPLANDTRTTVLLPAGVISGAGLQAISSYLYRATGDSALAYELDPLGDQWQTRTGNYPKRLSSLAYKTRKIKLSPDIMSQVGTIAREHSQPVSVEIEVTRELNLDAGEFGNEGSCWWGEYGSSRCALKSNGGFALRSFNTYGYVTGRAWVMPLRQTDLTPNGGVSTTMRRLVPTFDTLTPDAFVVFNGYGDLSDYAAPRIMAHLAGWTYRKISFHCSPMWVNSGGYLIAPEDIAQQCGSLQLTVNEHADLFHAETEKENAHA